MAAVLGRAAAYALPLAAAALAATALVLSFVVVLALISQSRLRQRAPQQRTAFLKCHLGRSTEQATATRLVGLFHPYCNAGGGGERVLWTALACMQRDLAASPTPTAFVVYTGDVGTHDGAVTKADILAKVEARFGVALSPDSLAFVPLTRRWLVEDATYPRLTLLGQSLGSVLLALEGLAGPQGVAPDVWIDTMGYAFAYPLVKWLLGVPVGSYTHYPTISTDMLSRVRSRTAGHTNPSSIASSAVLSRAKLVYYTAFARAYRASLARADTLMVNSKWTRRHVVRLLGGGEEEGEGEVVVVPDEGPSAAAAALASPDGLRRRPTASSVVKKQQPSTGLPRRTPRPRVRTVYPPCDTAALTSFPATTSSRVPSPTSPITILSLAQFRPEKEHATQLRAFAELVSPSSSSAPSLLPITLDPTRLRLVLAGSARHAADHARVAALRTLADELGVASQCEFVVNAPYDDVCALMRQASIGLHTMVDEHFGITVVEFQAAGLLTLAHPSAGPLLDILVPSSSPSHGTGPTGFLATSSPTSSSSSSTERHLPPHLAFATSLAHILALPEAEQDAVRARARESAQARFGVEAFERGWMDAWRELEGRIGAGAQDERDGKRRE
ncbi:hypothetical protein JCM3775_004454 [Rhodotorula graminis]